MDDYVELANNTNFGFDASFSIEIWMKPDSMGEGYHTIAQKGEEWQLKIFATPVFYVFEFGINNNSIFSSLQLDTDLVIGEWIHLVGVIDQTTGSENTIIYVNGIAGSSKSASAITSSSSKVKIGELFKGEIDEFRVWSTAQTLSQIRENKHLTSSVGDANITTYLPFNEGTGILANDLFGGNDGTLTNMNTTDAWINSSAPVGNGLSISKTETEGIVDFTGTGISANYTSHSSASVVVSRINGAPNQNPNLFDNQYWIMERYGSGDFDADLSYTVEDILTEEDAQIPKQIKLYKREENSYSYWDYSKYANSVDVANKTVEFQHISNDGQFALCRRYLPDDYVGNTLFFDGIDDHSDFGNSSILDIENNLTIEAWIKADELNENRRILCKGDNYFFEWDDEFESISGKGIQLKLPALNTGWWEFQYDMNYNQWYHIAFTYAASGELKAFVNGYNVRTESFQGDISSNTNHLILASNESESPFLGQVDELRIWNKVRSQQEIRANMCSTLSGLEQGLIGYWQFNEFQGDSLPDLVGGNDGQLNNMSNSNWESSTAPLPFISAQDGNWNDNDTWLTGQNYPDSAWLKVQIENMLTLDSQKEVASVSIMSSGALNCNPTAQLTVSDSLINNAGIAGLILNSDANNTASLISNTWNISAHVETYISAGQWHLVSPPVSSATVNDFYFPASTTSWLKRWDEVLDDWVYISDLYTSLSIGQGYATWFANEKSDETIDYTGKLKSGDVNLTLDYSGPDRGFNFIGNLYPSSLDWDIGSWIKDQTTGIAYIWDHGNYISRNSIGEGSLTDGIIPAGQGFFVQANSGSS
ncbi:LamG domain-containing protein [Lentimicrobium sp. S6]|uniref:LamG domain-containing protein n=1 Tax=Lentimicrobium sp. S6 TaxID=2735872 RepID=UPI001557FBEB|nr:LamG domain-containing protein [Lentimicrobium sp. S6]